MRVKVINDWEWLFSKYAVGGRFANFTFIQVGYFRTGIKDLDVDGLTVVLLGVGLRIRKGKV